MGHSGGTYKAVRYLFEGELKDKVNKIILLSPLDIKSVMINNGRSDIEGLLIKAQLKVTGGKGNELVTREFENDTMSYKTFISWYKQDDLGRMFEYCNPDYDFPILKQIQIPALAVIGSQDDYFPRGCDEAINALSKNITKFSSKIIQGADHCFKSFESVLVKEVSGFLFTD